MFTPKDILDFAIQLERNGESVYREASTRLEDSPLRELLEWAAGEEHRHAEWFGGIKDRVAADNDDPLISDMNDALVSDYFKDQSFSLKEADFSRMTTKADMIGVFVEFEEDTILFYQMLASFVTDESTAEMLNQIVDEEQNHIQELKELLPDTL